MLDLVVTRARIVEGGTLVERTIGVRDGAIEAILGDGDAPPARETVDAAGLIALPGLVDAHVHFRDPGLTAKEDFTTGSAAAAAGGVTTVMIMPTDDPLTATPATFEEKRRLGEGRCHVDYAIQAGVGSDVGAAEELASLGAVSFELFQTGYPAPLNVDDPVALTAVMAAVKATGRVLGVTPGHSGLLAHYAATARAQYGADRRGWGASWPAEIEAMGIATACLCAALSGGRVHLRQVSSARGLAALAAFRTADTTAEVTPHNLVLDDGALISQGPVAKVAPPLRPRADVQAMQQALALGAIDIVATDHAPHRAEEKAQGVADIWQAPGGFPGVQTLLPLLLKLVGDGVLDYPRLAAVASEAPARIFGLARKGRLVPGADADIVLVDPQRPMTILDDQQLSKAGRSPFHGTAVPATPLKCWLRGKLIMADGRTVGTPEGAFVRPA